MHVGQTSLVLLLFVFHAKSLEVINGKEVKLGERPWQVLKHCKTILIHEKLKTLHRGSTAGIHFVLNLFLH